METDSSVAAAPIRLLGKPLAAGRFVLPLGTGTELESIALGTLGGKNGGAVAGGNGAHKLSVPRSHPKSAGNGGS